MSQEDLSDRFRAYRQKCDLTQKDLAALLGVQSNFVYQIEARRRRPGKSLSKLFASLEAAERPARSSDYMPPPHHLPDHDPRKDSALLQIQSERDYAEAVMWLRQIFEQDKKIFHAAALCIKGMRDSLQ